ncbi:uncharacterized protein LOC106880719 isoform X2 [Octopus bimaculoides]|uniref:uncharacterized protein LOC106880719 isoform X2 n=1 Tax=Octopus bimaculoides TaxID=37653 RepID=UPI0022E15069|nr:uncharacterized protein LOC106880719 isoform X2 [Octopus bimaculoides]
METVNTNETQFLKTLEIYRKINSFSKSIIDISLMKSNKLKAIFLQVFCALFYIYLILNPIRHIVSLIQLKTIENDKMFLYIYIIFFRIFLSLSPFIKLFRKSRDKELIEKFAKLKTEDEDGIWYNNPIIYKSVYILICLIIIGSITLDFIIPLLSYDLLIFYEYPVPNTYTYIIPFLVMQIVFNSVSALSILTDVYIYLLIAVTLICHFNKVANEAQIYVTEKQSAKSDIITNHGEITDICNTHDALCLIVRLVNDSLQFISGFLVFGSVISCCIATYGIINDSFKTNMFINIYVAVVVTGCLSSWTAMLWCGIQLNRSDIKQEVIAKILVFLNRLTTESHGIDVGGCFVITPSSTLTMLGSFITYILVVIQTKSL